MSLDRGLSRGIKPTEARDLYRKAADAGCDVSVTTGNHVRVRTPSGKTVFGALTGSSGSVHHLRRKLRAAGVPV